MTTEKNDLKEREEGRKSKKTEGKSREYTEVEFASFFLLADSITADV